MFYFLIEEMKERDWWPAKLYFSTSLIESVVVIKSTHWALRWHGKFQKYAISQHLCRNCFCASVFHLKPHFVCAQLLRRSWENEIEFYASLIWFETMTRPFLYNNYKNVSNIWLSSYSNYNHLPFIEHIVEDTISHISC